MLQRNRQHWPLPTYLVPSLRLFSIVYWVPPTPTPSPPRVQPFYCHPRLPPPALLAFWYTTLTRFIKSVVTGQGPVTLELRASEQPFATLRIPFQRPTYLPLDAPTSPSLAPLSSPHPQEAPQTSPSVADAPPRLSCYEYREQYPPFVRTIASYALPEAVLASVSAYERGGARRASVSAI